MKPGTTLDAGQILPLEQPTTTTVVETDQPAGQKRINIDELPQGGDSRLLPVPTSMPEAEKGALVRARIEADADDEPRRPTGRRQKFLKVPDAKTLTKPARVLFRSVSDLLDGGVQRLRQRGDVSSDFGVEDA